MSQFQDLYDYTAQNPLKEVLSRFREGYENQMDPIPKILVLLPELQAYTARFSGNASIYMLMRQLYRFTGEIFRNKVSTFYFEKLIATINSNGSDLDVWAEVINLANNLTSDLDNEYCGESQSTPDIEIPFVRGKYTTTTHTRNAQEMQKYGKTCESLTVALKGESASDVYKNVGNFWEVYFKNPNWSQVTKRIWECYRDNNQCLPHVFKERMKESELHAWLYTF